MTTRRHGLVGLVGGLAAVAWPLAWAQTQDSSTRPLRVVASFSILADLVANVGGPAVEVHALVGRDADAHVFQPAPADVKRVAQADLVVVNGLHYEGWLTRLVQTAGFKGPVLVCSDGLTPRRLGSDTDPHAWQDLASARHYVARIRDALVQARPAQAEALRRRAADYTAQLDALDRQTRADFAALPADRRRVVSTHDAFGYFAAAYGIEFLAAQRWSTDSEPSAADVARLIRQLRQQRAAALFAENIADPRLMQRIAKESGAVVGGTLYSDALSAPGTAADTYLKLFRHNAQTLLAGLKGVPR
ncbi:metal ABC transporter substrate-binding protein [Sphaerotilus sp.]|jgi:zinc/manganese transport system substrate-binding protein|uniref:metal ABC transporter substrate-binding protein n=1 Tax=Sphaerotilus sp. TaxID=2093942 RepID=UPI0025FA01BC|nr:metal ABC transporter substrate-binding protein [Sphaerotilus sp.]